MPDALPRVIEERIVPSRSHTRASDPRAWLANPDHSPTAGRARPPFAPVAQAQLTRASKGRGGAWRTDGPNHYTLLVREQAKALYRYWPEVQDRLFD
jgi:hypothetical protein